jgi:hypothetical protein
MHWSYAPSVNVYAHSTCASFSTIYFGTYSIMHEEGARCPCMDINEDNTESTRDKILLDREVTTDEVINQRMSSGILCQAALVRTYISEEPSASIIRVTRIGELGKLAITSNRRMLRRNTLCILDTLMMEALGSSETPVLTRGTRCNIPEDGIFHSHCCENLKSYKVTNRLQISHGSAHKIFHNTFGFHKVCAR